MKEKYKIILITAIISAFVTWFITSLINEDKMLLEKDYVQDLEYEIKKRDEIIEDFKGYLDDINDKIEFIYQYTVPDNSKVNDDFDFDH